MDNVHEHFTVHEVLKKYKKIKFLFAYDLIYGMFTLHYL